MMKQLRVRVVVFLGLCGLSLVSPLSLFGVIHRMAEVKEVGIREALGSSVDMSMALSDHDKKRIPVKEAMIPNKPVVIVPVYFTCKYLCTYTLRGVAHVINQTDDFLPGVDYTLLAVSMNPDDTAENARAFRESMLSQLRPDIQERIKPEGIRFLFGKDTKKFLNSVGFYYKKDENEYAHTAALIFLSPEAKITRYLYGIQYKPRDYRLALLESGQGKIGTVIDKLVLYCFHYNPSKRYYGLIAWNVMKVGSVGFAGLFLLFLMFLFYNDRKKKSKKKEEGLAR